MRTGHRRHHKPFEFRAGVSLARRRVETRHQGVLSAFVPPSLHPHSRSPPVSVFLRKCPARTLRSCFEE